MIDAIRMGLRHAIILIIVGAGVGATVGWSGVFVYTTAEQVATLGGTLYRSLFVLLPLTVVGATLVTQRRTQGVYAETPSALTVLLTAGIVGGIGGIAGFLTAATNLPAIFGGYDAQPLSRALREAIGPDMMVWCVVTTALTALLAGFWLTRRAGR